MHRIDGPGATVDNRFTEGDPVGGIQATVVTDDFLNDVQEELMSVLTAAGVTPVKGTQNQVLQAVSKLAQNQTAQAFTTGGTGAALTLTPSPAISAYAAPLRFSVKFHVDSGANPTLNASAKGAKSLKQYSATGAKVAAVFFADQIGDVVYDGVDWVLVDQLPTTTANLVGIRGAALNLRVSATGTDSVIAITADELQVENAAGQFITLRNVSCTASFAVAGAGGLASGAANSQLASTLYYAHVIWDGTTAKGWLAPDVNPATPLPGAFTHRTLVAWTITDSTTNKFPLSFIKNGRIGQFKVGGNVTQLPRMVSGIQGNPNTPSWVAVAISPYFAPNVAAIYLSLYSQGALTQTVLAPSNNYGAANASTNMPLVNISNSSSNSNQNNFLARIVPESNSVYYASNATVSNLSAVGWEDNF
ncbi:hypothetical protein [Pseudomonas sp. CHM02]|uniref:hypothetical protein n=1 Tax=Pseudomonas sp. CHM02 TaxID=1463662 RepID=UPI000471E572|nr:hypothetical protein [Pseudomonas sp. CHM02]